MKELSFLKLATIKYGAAAITILTTTLLASTLNPESYSKFSLIINISAIISTIALFGVHRNFPYDYKVDTHKAINLYTESKIRIIKTIQVFFLPGLSILSSTTLLLYGTIKPNEIVIVSLSIFGISASLVWFQSIQLLSNFIGNFTEHSFAVSLTTRIIFFLFSSLLLISDYKNPFYFSIAFSLICIFFLLYELDRISKLIKPETTTQKKECFFSSIPELKNSINRSKWSGLDSTAALLISLAPSIILTTINPEDSAGMNLSLTLINGSLLVAGIMQIKVNSIIFNSKTTSKALKTSYPIAGKTLLFWLSTQFFVFLFLLLMKNRSDVFLQASDCYLYMLIGGLFSFANKLIIPFLMSHGLDQKIFKSTIASGAISLTIGAIIIPKFQVYGSVATFIIGYFVSFLFLSCTLISSNYKKQT